MSFLARAVLFCCLFFPIGWVSAAERVEIEQDGLTLIGFLKEAAPPEEGVVLMLHGTLAHGQMELLSAVQELLAEQGKNSLAINLSYGISAREGMFECDRPVLHGLDQHFAEIDAWMQWLEATQYGPITLFGHSRGGNQIARYFVERGGETIRSLVLLAPSTYDPERAEMSYSRQSDLPLRVRLDQAEELLRMGQPRTLLSDTRFLYCESIEVSPEAFLGYYRVESGHDTPTVVQDITTPVLVIIGSEDEVVADLPERMAALPANPMITTETIDGADHFFRDFFADDVVDAMMQFMLNK